jgi:uncharacterized protein (TIGR03435 family)
LTRNMFLAVTIGSALASICSAQATRLTFEVASIRPSKTNEPWFWDVTPGGRLVARNCSLKTLLVLAYSLQEFQIVGGPAWASRDQFDIEAKPDNVANPTDEQSRQMLRVLLEKRFQLKVRMETKNGPVYILRVVRNGPPLSADQTPPMPTGPPPAPDGRMPRGTMRMRAGDASGIAVPIPLLARFLGQTLGRPVLDKTGLTGRYDINLHWTPDQMSQDLTPGAPIPQADGPSLFTALQEQMGLRLESATGPVEQLVIERADRRSEN